MKKYNKFITVYKDSRHNALLAKAGLQLADQQKLDTSNVSFKRFVYQTFKQEVQKMFGLNIDRNTWVFDQNELKENSNGKESLKILCETYYFNNEALFLAQKTDIFKQAKKFIFI